MRNLVLFLGLSSLPALCGCGLISTKTVALAAGKEVGKHIYEKLKEEKREQEAQQAGPRSDGAIASNPG